MAPTSAEYQVEFLANIQRLLAEASFVATYKYALLMALADIAVESGDDSGNALQVTTAQIADKFITYYWRQTLPYLPRSGDGEGHVLRQNTGRQAAVIRRIVEARQELGASLASSRQSDRWNHLLNQVDRIVREMPLWKLQTVGREQLDFLYQNTGKGKAIELRPGVAYCLRKFHSLVGDLVRGAWVRYVRRHNHDVLGTTADLSEFLFGTERSDVSAYREILFDLQAGGCFYCDRRMQPATSHVDHFIPWSRYPVDLGHNFVLAHASCNSNKADHLASEELLARWFERNNTQRLHLENEFTERGLLHSLPTSNRIAVWAYEQTYSVGGLTWAWDRDGTAFRALENTRIAMTFAINILQLGDGPINTCRSFEVP